MFPTKTMSVQMHVCKNKTNKIRFKLIIIRNEFFPFQDEEQQNSKLIKKKIISYFI